MTDAVKIVGMFLIPLLAVLVPVLIGQYYGIYRQKKLPASKEVPVGAVAGAALALLGFMLALTFQIASNRFSARKEKLLEEVTHLRTTWLRSGLIPEPYRSNSKKYVVEYVDQAVALTADPSKLNQVLSRSQQALDSLWSYAEALAQQDRSSEAYSLFTSSVNDVINAHHQRITLALEYRMPNVVLWALLIVEFLSMLIFGYQMGLTGRQSIKLNLLLAATFAVVMMLIYALDRPEAGLATINQKPMHTLHQELHTGQAGPR